MVCIKRGCIQGGGGGGDVRKQARSKIIDGIPVETASHKMDEILYSGHLILYFMLPFIYIIFSWQGRERVCTRPWQTMLA